LIVRNVQVTSLCSVGWIDSVWVLMLVEVGVLSLPLSLYMYIIYEYVVYNILYEYIVHNIIY